MRELGSILCAALLVCALLGGASALFQEEGAAEASTVRILRVMTSNPAVCLPVGGEYRDWVELANLSDEAVSLKNWRLTSGLDVRGGFVFGDVVLQPGETLVVYGGDPVPDAEEEALFGGFSLSSDGDSLTLSDGRTQVRDHLEIPALPAGRVYALSGENYAECSPYDSLGVGLDLARELEPKSGADGVVISEIMALNGATLQDENGLYSDWIELYNRSGEAICLAGYSLTDDEMNRRRFVFPDVTLQAGEYLVVFASGAERRSGELHAGFKLSSKGERVLLFDAMGCAVARMEYDSLEADQSVILRENGATEKTYMPSPGQPNTLEGARASMDADYTTTANNALGLYINEVLCGASGTYDWVELINLSGSALDLSGFGLSDNPNHPRKWRFPEGTALPAGGLMTVQLTGSQGASGLVDGVYCANFALDADADETLVLSDADGAFVDRMLLCDQRRGISYGRSADGSEYVYFASPTPGAANSGTTYRYCAQPVTFSQPGGIQDGPVTLTLSAQEGMTIYYTLDGSEPTASSMVYSGPLTIAQNTVVKAVAWRGDAIASYAAANTYLFGVSHTVGIVAVSGNPDELTGSDGTLITGKVGSGYDVYAEIYDANGNPLVSQGCQLKLNGRSSRTVYAQKAFRLVAKNEYGDNRFRAELFSQREYEEYKAVLVRAAGQDNQLAFMRDVLLTSLARNTSVMYQESETVAVYINGAYWGVYHLRERICAETICQFEGWDNPDAVDLLEGEYGTVAQGSNATFKSMMSAVKKYGVSSDENLAALRELMDVENYLEYVMLQIYSNNQDLNNVRMYRSAEEDGKWRWILFDMDLGFRASRDPVKEWLSSSGEVGSITAQSNVLFTALMKNDEMRDWFLTRFGELLATDLSSESVVARIYEEAETLNPEMQMQCERWNWSKASWTKHGNSLVSYAQKQPAKIISALIDNFGLTDEQARHYFGKAMENEGMNSET